MATSTLRGKEANAYVFTRDDLIQYLQNLVGNDNLPPLEVAEFRAHQFQVPMQGIRVAHRGGLEDFPSAFGFWTWSVRLVDWSQRLEERPATDRAFLQFAGQALCEPMSAQAYFEGIDSFLEGLKRPAPAFLRRRDSFVARLKMYDGVVLGDFKYSVLGRFEDEYVAFHSRVPL